MKAIWKNQVIADSEETVVVEGNHYFPPSSLDNKFLREGDAHSTCPWKGEASYYDIVVGEHLNRDAAWYYPEPKSAAQQIAGYVAFWRGVEIVE